MTIRARMEALLEAKKLAKTITFGSEKAMQAFLDDLDATAHVGSRDPDVYEAFEVFLKSATNSVTLRDIAGADFELAKSAWAFILKRAKKRKGTISNVKVPEKGGW